MPRILAIHEEVRQLRGEAVAHALYTEVGGVLGNGVNFVSAAILVWQGNST
jgi:hypothetical protein